MANARESNSGLTYLRRSTSGQELSLEMQLRWAIERAKELHVDLDVSLADLAVMTKEGLHSYKAIRVDDGVSGSELARPGLQACIRDAKADKRISHVFVHKRDRLSRPNDPAKGMLLESEITSAGVYLVLSDRIVEPRDRSDTNLGEQLVQMISYHESGEYLLKLAERIIQAQRVLAKGGFWTGGRPPYGFERVLVDEKTNEVVEVISAGRYVRKSGCHVRIRAGDPEKIATWLHILNLKTDGWGFKRIANHLNERGVPSPGAKTVRTDQGARHLVSGMWSPGTVRELCLSRTILGILDYGRRSEGHHRRQSATGPRPLSSSDRRGTDGDPIIIRNNDDAIVSAKFTDPIFDPAKWKTLNDEIGRRAKSQRGQPRVRDLSTSPLSCRVVDLTDDCGSIMYVSKRGKKSKYCCGRYMRTAGAQCHHNEVDGEAILRFALATIQQILQQSTTQSELHVRLQFVAQQIADRPDQARVAGNAGKIMSEIRAREGDLETLSRRMGKEKDDECFEVLKREFKRLKGELTRLQTAHTELQAIADRTTNLESLVERAEKLANDLVQVINDPAARSELSSLFGHLGIRIGLRFTEGVMGRKRLIRRLVGGVIAFADAPLPVPLHGKDATGGRASGQTPIESRKKPGISAETNNLQQTCDSFIKDGRGERI